MVCGAGVLLPTLAVAFLIGALLSAAFTTFAFGATAVFAAGVAVFTAAAVVLTGADVVLDAATAGFEALTFVPEGLVPVVLVELDFAVVVLPAAASGLLPALVLAFAVTVAFVAIFVVTFLGAGLGAGLVTGVVLVSGVVFSTDCPSFCSLFFCCHKIPIKVL